jgi:ADP-ribosylglycohydrolase
MTCPADRCRGVLLGLAAGDRNGGPIRMAVRLAESLLDCGGFEPMDILERYLNWWREGAFDTGPVSGRALELMAAGVPVAEATAQVHREFGKTAGCNPTHRSSPLSMLASIADHDLAAYAMAEARLTHHDPLAGQVAAAVNGLCRALIRGAAWDGAVRCTSFADQEGPGNNGGFAPDVLRGAVYFVGTSEDFAEALERSLAFAGPANYCPVLVGAIAGARWGATSAVVAGPCRYSPKGPCDRRGAGCRVVIGRFMIAALHPPSCGSGPAVDRCRLAP